MLNRENYGEGNGDKKEGFDEGLENGDKILDKGRGGNSDKEGVEEGIEGIRNMEEGVNGGEKLDDGESEGIERIENAGDVNEEEKNVVKEKENEGE
ncbi:hypothetical protein, partial [Staphylococcus warneri]|uniref:hypothetical protein n=1 Tax=Staphylococcus warneri TaxID=1292 RepID=UPI001C95CDAD